MGGCVEALFYGVQHSIGILYPWIHIKHLLLLLLLPARTDCLSSSLRHLSTFRMEPFNQQLPIPYIKLEDEGIEAVVAVTHQLLGLFLSQHDIQVYFRCFKVREGKDEHLLEVPADLH